MEKYNKNCGLTYYEWRLEKIVDKIKEEDNMLICIKILEKEIQKIPVCFKCDTPTHVIEKEGRIYLCGQCEVKWGII